MENRKKSEFVLYYLRETDREDVNSMSGIRTAREEEFDRVFSLMERSFPPDEYRGYDGQRALLREPAYTIYVDPDEGDIPRGFVTVWQFDDFAFVEHLATEPSCRGQGRGSAILHELSGRLGCRIVLEVELPETEIAARRIEFYRRNGFVTNDYPYIQPAYSVEKHALPLILMTTDGPVSQTEFRSIRDALYRTVYRVKEKIKNA